MKHEMFCALTLFWCAPASAKDALPEPQASPPIRMSLEPPDAAVEPRQPAYFNGAQRSPWSEGVDYTLIAAPEQVSDIALQPGEALVSVAAGDTARWVIGDTSSGSGPSRRAHVLVKPVQAGLKTNLVIATDRRVYHIRLESRPRASVSSLSWTYPEDSLLVLKAHEASRPAEQSAAFAAIEALNFNYEIKGEPVSWRPLRAFDDGRQLFIEFGPGLAQDAAPPLFICGADGKPELVNYRVRGRYYVVDRLFAHGELRLGEGRQQKVSIKRAGAARSRCGDRG